ncbi:uncharacterized protein IL334_003126 [Kwoniella shivajii]|uniref:ASX DEUBAD domain-containing protein n=1 Tax=Kwoniella shivajii TaxID=564305 RepID=A0ABZ1CWN9_9TREE|nr:hypothetical protein IL334_003126 [Kwoniella shivajii]
MTNPNPNPNPSSGTKSPKHGFSESDLTDTAITTRNLPTLLSAYTHPDTSSSIRDFLYEELSPHSPAISKALLSIKDGDHNISLKLPSDFSTVLTNKDSEMTNLMAQAQAKGPREFELADTMEKFTLKMAEQNWTIAHGRGKGRSGSSINSRPGGSDYSLKFNTSSDTTKLVDGLTNDQLSAIEHETKRTTDFWDHDKYELYSAALRRVYGKQGLPDSMAEALRSHKGWSTCASSTNDSYLNSLAGGYGDFEESSGVGGQGVSTTPAMVSTAA